MMTFLVINTSIINICLDIETSTNIAKTNVTRFALCVDKQALLKIQAAPS